MLVINNSVQPRLFRRRESQERFILRGREANSNTPDWIASNDYAKKLKQEEIIFFETLLEVDELEEIKEIARDKKISFGEHVTIEQLKELISSSNG
jgi:hypothetical protein